MGDVRSLLLFHLVFCFFPSHEETVVIPAKGKRCSGMTLSCRSQAPQQLVLLDKGSCSGPEEEEYFHSIMRQSQSGHESEITWEESEEGDHDVNQEYA